MVTIKYEASEAQHVAIGLQMAAAGVTTAGFSAAFGARGFSSEALRSATAPGTNASQPYTDWSGDNWHFGTAEQYPAIKYNDATCATVTPSENCGELLPRQRPGLRDIVVSQIGGLEQPQLSPAFSTIVRDYTTYINSNTIETKITVSTFDPNSLVSINGNAASVGSAEYFLSSNFSMATVVTVQVTQPDTLGSEEDEYTIRFNRFPIVSDIKRQVAENEQSEPFAASVGIREGHFITLSSEISDADSDDYSYQWEIADETQVSVVDAFRAYRQCG